MIQFPRSLRQDQKGATLVEFALVLTPLLISIMGLLELGYQAYVEALLQGALQTAARDASIASKTPTQIQEQVYQALNPLVRRENVTTTVRSYYNYSRIGKPEKLVTDYNGNGRYDAGDCFEDANDNNAYDTAASAGRQSGGNADEIVAYTIEVSYPRILPTARLVGLSDNGTASGTTMLRNQPFARNVTIRTVCK